MKMVDPRTGIEVLDEDECLRLLGTEEIGRLAVVDGTTPVIFPVNYVLDGRTIVFRTDEGTKLDRGERAGACFEIDRFDRSTRTGWSVIAAGRLEEITKFDSNALADAKALPIDPWAGGDKAHWMRLNPSRITGRRVAPPR
jgi:nitroimidazol reductase NimA-like FMN-containing flavoprotein (pyridoxamine 5'-phosphate oxidase superfamily)